ncbi:MAG: Hpt domain-containing protein, partial [Aliarcobacter sp.]|nr:Hpt domain-containing protein [Aliarcobacter sp.]
MSFDISKYREMFLEEAEELFESADNVLLEAENNGSLTDEEMGQLFRDVHTLKGSGASVELVFFAEFTHDVESLMDKLRNHKIEYIPEMAETLIDGLDVMKEILDLEVSNTLTREIFTSMTTALLQEIRAYSSGDTVKKEPVIEVKKSEVKKAIVKEEVTHNENFGFFDDDLNDQRDSSVKAYGIFADDDIDEEQKNYGFYDNDLEKLSNDIGD